MQYPAKLSREGGRILVDFVDFPNVHTYGDDKTEALARAADAVETMIMAMIADGDDIPAPSAIKRNLAGVRLSAPTEAKISLYREMRAAHVGKVKLARRLKWHVSRVNRLLDLRHASRLDEIDQAFLALGKRLTISFDDAA